VTLPIATAYLILPSLKRRVRRRPVWPTFTSPMAYVSPIWSLGPTSKGQRGFYLPSFWPTSPPALTNWQFIDVEQSYWAGSRSR